MEKPIVTALFIVVSMILVVMLFNAVYPAVQQGSDAVTSMAYNVSDRMKNQFSIIHASAELPTGGGFWQETSSNNLYDVFAWLKNTGSVSIRAIDRLDVFFGPEGNYTRIPYRVDGTTPYPNWTWNVENDTDWVPTATLQIVIHYSPIALPIGRYYLQVTLPNGMSSDYFLGI